MEPRFAADRVRAHSYRPACARARPLGERTGVRGRPQRRLRRRVLRTADGQRPAPVAHELHAYLQQGATTRLARTPTAGGGDGDAQVARDERHAALSVIKEPRSVHILIQEITDGKTAHWRVWNWARAGGTSKVVDRDPSGSSTNSWPRHAVPVTARWCSRSRTSRPNPCNDFRGPARRWRGTSAQPRSSAYNDNTIRMVIPLVGKPMTAGRTSRRPAQPSGPRGCRRLGRQPGRTPDAPKDRVVVGGPGRQAGRTSDAPRDPVVVGRVRSRASRPVDDPRPVVKRRRADHRRIRRHDGESDESRAAAGADNARARDHAGRSGAQAAH